MLRKNPSRRPESVQVFCQTAIANLVEAEEALDHEEAVFNLRAHLRLGAIATTLLITQRMIACRLLLREVLRVPSTLPDYIAQGSADRLHKLPLRFLRACHVARPCSHTLSLVQGAELCIRLYVRKIWLLLREIPVR